MKKTFSDFKKGIVKLKIDSLDDLWYLSQIIEQGDFVSGKTERKIKLGNEGDRSGKVTRKLVFIEINVEKIELTESCIRVSGKVAQGPDDVPLGSYHTFNLEPSKYPFTLKKNNWLTYQKNKLKEAIHAIKTKILILVLDRENAIFAVSERDNYRVLAEISGNVAKKDENVNVKGSFYSELEKMLLDYVERYKPDHIITASPAFFKEDFLKSMKDSVLKKKITFATCSSVTSNAINEVMKRPEVSNVLKQDMVTKETIFVEKLMQEISKDGLAVYGIKETLNAAELGAVSILLVSDNKIKEARLNNTYGKLEKAMKLADSSKGEVHLIGSNHEGGKILDGLGGIAGILRFKIK